MVDHTNMCNRIAVYYVITKTTTLTVRDVYMKTESRAILNMIKHVFIT